MTKVNEKMLKNHVSMDDFAAKLDTSKPTISQLRAKGVLPADVFVKSGRKVYVHEKNAIAALRSAPIAEKGAVPAWALKAGNKAAAAKAKALANAAKGVTKKAA